MLMLTMTWVILTMIATTPMVLGTKFLPISSTEVASDVAATDGDPSGNDIEKDSVGEDNDTGDEDPGDTDEDSGGDGGCYKVLASLLYRACL